jgi:hypothetical protein
MGPLNLKPTPIEPFMWSSMGMTHFAKTKFGSHSVRKYASTTGRNLGATKAKKYIHGRWKSTMHVLDFYNDVELPFPDLKLAGLLCPGGPVCYAIRM